MPRTNKTRLDIQTRGLLALVLLICFGALSAFSPLLHDHAWDAEPVHKDCAACQWNQVPSQDEAAPPLTLPPPRITAREPEGRAFAVASHGLVLTSRSPPRFS